MFVKLVSFALVVGFAAVLPACASEETSPSPDEEVGDNEIRAKKAKVVEIGGASGQSVAIKEGEDILVKLAGPSPTPFTGWTVKTTSGLGGPKEGWTQGEGAVGRSGFSTFLWHTAKRPTSLVGSHQVVLEIDRGHGDGVSTFEFTAKIAK